ncbi:unnamed protein product [Clonostachys rosea]|uniref:SHSP domain-containing protein n=1 Tax=Bionectria ochroleuca TaxID=29856 RepID=A0ABY6U8I1_BIOOC|nr:unnamed protein product [Clonostachys rosea]
MEFFPRTVYNTGASSSSSPFNTLAQLIDEFDKYSRQDSSKSQEAPAPTFHWQPKFDVRETAEAYHLYGELPGVAKDQIAIEFPETQRIVISGKTERSYVNATNGSRPNSRQATVEDEAEAGEKVAADATPRDTAKYWLSERSIGQFSRTFSLPSRVDEEAVSASLKDGILSVVIPKAKKYEARNIIVN